MFIHVPSSTFTIEAETRADGVRFYSVPGGLRYPSVTTVLGYQPKAELNAWRERVGAEEAARIGRQASLRGSKIHLMIEQHLNNQEIQVPNLSFLDTLMFKSLLPYLARINNIRSQEVGLYSHYLRMAGRVDCIAEWDGKLSIIDFKTSNRQKEKEWITNYFMQTAAYAIMWEELTGEAIPRTVVLITVDDGSPQVFVEKRNTWVKGLLAARDYFEANFAG